MSTAPREVSVVFPAYDEAVRLPALLDVLTTSAEEDLARGGLRFLEAVVVDDGSTDVTPELLAAAAEKDSRIRPLRPWTENRGKGAALKAGIEAARGELTLLVDVDLSTPLTEAWKLSAAMQAGGEPIAIGSRDIEGSYVEAPLYRRVLGAGFNLTVKALTGLRFADTQSGFKLLETEVARELVGEQLAAGFAFDVELLLRARLAGYPVAEVPVSYVHDSRSKLRVVRSAAQMSRDVVRLSVRLKRGGTASRSTRRSEDADPA